MKRFLRITLITTICIFAAAGFVLVGGYALMRAKLTNTRGRVDTQTAQFINKNEQKKYQQFPLAHSPEWIAFRIAVAKDKQALEQVYTKTGVSPRILVSILVPEQMRLFHSERPLFKQVFEPLKILGNQSQFSWGILGIKDETARAIEKNLGDENSPFYPGKSYSELLRFSTESPDQERFARIIDEEDHYYGYLYAALYIKQIEAEWAKSGQPIHNQVGVLATLWNLGFEKSKPNANPKVGGSILTINEKEYSFGGLAQAFYDSDELVEIFPASE